MDQIVRSRIGVEMSSQRPFRLVLTIADDSRHLPCATITAAVLVTAVIFPIVIIIRNTRTAAGGNIVRATKRHSFRILKSR
jgi:hypothetical protein